MNLLPNVVDLGLGIKDVKLLEVTCLTRAERCFEHPLGDERLDSTALTPEFGYHWLSGRCEPSSQAAATGEDSQLASPREVAMERATSQGHAVLPGSCGVGRTCSYAQGGGGRQI